MAGSTNVRPDVVFRSDQDYGVFIDAEILSDFSHSKKFGISGANKP
jgi:hypothetical protein